MKRRNRLKGRKEGSLSSSFEIEMDEEPSDVLPKFHKSKFIQFC